jgi:hypothetical protein
MMSRAMVFALVVMLVTLPTISWAAKSSDKHDCHAEKGGKYVCDRGPLTGKTFASKKSMIEAMRAGSGAQSQGEAQALSAKPIKTKVSKKK